jgi:hypothetical protein
VARLENGQPPDALRKAARPSKENEAMTADTFPPAESPEDKAKYRQFLIDHELDPNLKPEDLRRAVAEKSDAEKAQLEAHWRSFVSAQ